MEIKIKEKPSDLFYDEFLYITSNYKKVIKAPDTKVKLLTKSITDNCIIIFIGLVFEIIFYVIAKDKMYLYLAGILLFMLFIHAVYYVSVKKRIKIFRESDYDSKIIVDNKGISLKKKDQNVSLTYDAINMIVINKYSIVVFPKDLSLVFLGIPVDYKEDFIQAIKDNHKYKLLVNNEEEYK